MGTGCAVGKEFRVRNVECSDVCDHYGVDGVCTVSGRSLGGYAYMCSAFTRSRAEDAELAAFIHQEG